MKTPPAAAPIMTQAATALPHDDWLTPKTSRFPHVLWFARLRC
jgi:hypothetical protein